MTASTSETLIVDDVIVQVNSVQNGKVLFRCCCCVLNVCVCVCVGVCVCVCVCVSSVCVCCVRLSGCCDGRCYCSWGVGQVEGVCCDKAVWLGYDHTQLRTYRKG